MTLRIKLAVKVSLCEKPWNARLTAHLIRSSFCCNLRYVTALIKFQEFH